MPCLTHTHGEFLNNENIYIYAEMLFIWKLHTL
jgi:hypothetical protein